MKNTTQSYIIIFTHLQYLSFEVEDLLIYFSSATRGHISANVLADIRLLPRSSPGETFASISQRVATPSYNGDHSWESIFL